MNWTNLLITCIIAIGGFMAATYEVLAKRQGLPVGFYFRLNGIMVILGSLITFGAVIFSAFINPWWTILIVFALAWLFSQVFVQVFKAYAQLLSFLLIIAGLSALALRFL